MKHLRTFESFSKSTEDETKDFLDQFGEDSDAAIYYRNWRSLYRM